MGIGEMGHFGTDEHWSKWALRTNGHFEKMGNWGIWANGYLGQMGIGACGY